MAFRSQLTVRFGDIDHAGIVYYPRFLHYFHVALEEFFPAMLELEYPTLIDKHRIGLPTVHLEGIVYRPKRGAMGAAGTKCEPASRGTGIGQFPGPDGICLRYGLIRDR